MKLLTLEQRAAIIIDWVYGDTPSDSHVDYEIVLQHLREALGQAYAGVIEVAETEWKKHPYPVFPDPSENAQLTALRIRDAIMDRARKDALKELTDYDKELGI